MGKNFTLRILNWSSGRILLRRLAPRKKVTQRIFSWTSKCIFFQRVWRNFNPSVQLWLWNKTSVGHRRDETVLQCDVKNLVRFLSYDQKTSLTCAQNARELKNREREFHFSCRDPLLHGTKNFCPISNVPIEFSAQKPSGDSFLRLKKE